MKLEIITPEQIFFSGEVNSVTLPGSNGKFTIWENHAPLVSILSKGKITYKLSNDIDSEFDIDGGVVENCDNVIVVCVEVNQ